MAGRPSVHYSEPSVANGGRGRHRKAAYISLGSAPQSRSESQGASWAGIPSCWIPKSFRCRAWVPASPLSPTAAGARCCCRKRRERTAHASPEMQHRAVCTRMKHRYDEKAYTQEARTLLMVFISGTPTNQIGK